jgi:plasmid stabilization system protein ParE
LQIKDTYLRAFDLTAALQEKKRLEEQAARLAEHKRQQEEKRQQVISQEPKTIVVDGNAGLEEAKPGDRVVFGGEPITAPIEIVVDFRVWATNEQLKALGQYMRASGIKYGKVPTEKEAI